MAYDEVFEHFDATADVIVGVDHLAELHVAVDEVYVGLLKHFHLRLQFLNPGFVVIAVHIGVALLMVQRYEFLRSLRELKELKGVKGHYFSLKMRNFALKLSIHVWMK